MPAYVLPLLIFIAALLYSSVGHAGASGYLAAMALAGVAPEHMKPSALILNIFVASIATFKFVKAGCFSWKVFFPFAVGSVPLAFIGGSLSLPGKTYKQVVGAILLFAAVRLFMTARKDVKPEHRDVAFPVAMLCGAGIGLLSGLTGTGGGIFLSPLLLFMGWAETKETSGVSAAFILANSIAGILGNLPRVDALPPNLPFWIVAAVAGGLLGSHFGSYKFDNILLRRLLVAVLIVAGLKLMFA